MQSLVLVVHVILAMLVIGLVLIQHGKGADAGAAFGSGASSTVFGAKGSASFLTKMTTLAALAFFVTSLSLFYLAANRQTSTGSVVDNLTLPAASEEVKTEGAGESDLPAAPAGAGTSESELPVAPKSE